MKNNFFTENRSKILIGLLVISLVANIFLFTKVNSDENKISDSADTNYAAFFTTLRNYSNSLESLANNDLQTSGDGERELQVLSGQSFNLVEHARTYSSLSDEKDELSNLIWNFTVHLQEITDSFNEDDIINNRDYYKEFSRTINEIVELENETKIEMLRDDEGFEPEKMHTVLKPIVEKTMELQLSNK